jgi:hypothetical protein
MSLTEWGATKDRRRLRRALLELLLSLDSL